MTKKVLFVATVAKIHIVAFHLPYLEWFYKNGYEVHVCAKNDYEDKNNCNIPYCDRFFDLQFERSPFKKKNISTLKILKTIIDKNKYDIIHCHTPMGGVLTRLASMRARENGSKVFYTAHGFHFYKGSSLISWLIYYPIEKLLSRCTDVLLTINSEDYSRACKFKAKKVEYIPGVGIDTMKYGNLKIDKKSKRESVGITSDDFMIISVGEINKNKNHQVIIKAISLLNNKKIKYIICGKGPLEKKIIKLIKKLEMQDQVILLGFRNDIPELLKVSDLFAFPSFREGLSLSLMEAMACGLPVICSDIRGNSDLVYSGKGGYLVNPNKVKEFSEKISMILNDENIKSNFSIFNLKKIKNFSIDNVLKKMEILYKSELNNWQ